jgi:hypothetical protein
MVFYFDNWRIDYPWLGHVIVFGGQNNEMPLDDTWELLP